MAKTTTVTQSKTATKAANSKPIKAKKDKVDKADKPKRAPTAYNLFVKANMQSWLAANQGKTHKDAMAGIGLLWRDAPENPNRGKEPKPRQPKTPKEKGGKENKAKASKSKKEASASSEVEESGDDE